MKHAQVIVAFVITSWAPAVAQTHGEDLGIASGWFYAGATHVSDDGSVVAGYAESQNAGRGARWTESTGMQTLPLDTLFNSDVSAMSSDGSVLAGSGWSSSTFTNLRPVLWNGLGAPQDLGDLGAPNWAGVTCLSSDGTTAAGFSKLPNGNFTAVRWVIGSGIEALGTLGGVRSSSEAINSDGSVVVGFERMPNFDFASFRWSAASGVVNITPTYPTSFAYDVSADGSVVVGTAKPTSGSASSAYRWTAATGPVLLGPARVNLLLDFPMVSADGSTVAWSNEIETIDPQSGASNYVYEGYRWTAATGTVALPADFVPAAISADGSVIGGHINLNTVAHPAYWSEVSGLVLLEDFGSNFSFVTDVSTDGQWFTGRIGPLGRRAARWNRDEEIGQRYCGPVTPNSTGQPAVAIATGTNRSNAGTTVLLASALPASSFGYFLVSPMQGDVFPVNQSQGRLCLGGAIGRFNGSGQIFNSGSMGEFAFTIPTQAIATPNSPVPALPGQSWNFQAWYRDIHPNQTSNFTNGVRVTFQ